MAYRKLLVDNPACSRRFHLTFDDESTERTKVEITCPFCNVVIFQKDNHPPVKMARQENLVVTNAYSPPDAYTRECLLRDVFSEKTQPKPSAPH